MVLKNVLTKIVSNRDTIYFDVFFVVCNLKNSKNLFGTWCLKQTLKIWL